MNTFVETTEFSKRQPRYLPGDAYGELQKALITNPQKGDVMPGCGGLRKLRIADPKRQKGKRGGARVMSAETKRRPLAERLKAGLTEGIQFAKGDLTLRTVEIPSPPPAIAAKEVTSLRAEAGMSQAVFARVLNVSAKTVQSWEQGERKPSHAALRMLQVFRENPRFIFEVVGLSTLARGRAARPRRRVTSS